MTKIKQENCIFCMIEEGIIKTPWVFWEDEEFMAFLWTSPNTEGMTVLITKNHYPSDVLALPDDVLQRFTLAAKKVSNILLDSFDDVWRVWLIMEWTWVNHAHIKLYPMHWTDFLKRWEWNHIPSTNNKYFKTYEGYVSSNDSEMVSDEEIKKVVDKIKK